MINTNDIRVKSKSYSQNAEDIFVLDYFKGFKGTLLEIGANDGKTLSNSLLLIENGWKAHLVEPGSVCSELNKLHQDNHNVSIHNFAIGAEYNRVKFMESGAHEPGGSDVGLVSTLDENEKRRWAEVDFTETIVNVNPFEVLEKYAPFDFISIDAEGYDWIILQQINLADMGCKALCIEWNSLEALQVRYMDYCALHGLKLAQKNAENLIFVK